MKNFYLLPILEKISKSGYSNCEVTSLFNYMTSIAKTYCRNRNKKSMYNFLDSWILLEDLIWEALQPLITISDSKILSGLQSALDNWQNPIETEEQAEYFIHKIVWTRCEQELIHKLKESDPIFTKILNAIQYEIKKNGYEKTSYFGTIFIVESETSKINNKVIPLNDFEMLPDTFFLLKSYRKVLKELFCYIKTETDFFPAIPLNALVKKIKQVHASQFRIRSTTSDRDYIEENINIEFVVNKSLETTLEKIDGFYFTKNKFSHTERETFKKILNEMAADLKNGSYSHGLYEYFHPYMAEVSREVFYKKYHSTLDYLLRVLKKEIAENLEVV